MIGETPDMEFIDDQVAHGAAGLWHGAPVENIPDDTGVITPGLFHAPQTLTGYGTGIRIKQDGIGVESQPVFRFIRAVDLVGVFEFLDIQPEYDHGIDIPYLIGFGKRKPGIGNRCVPVEEQERAGGAVMGVDGKVHAHREHHGSMHIKKSGADGKAFDFGHGCQGHIELRNIL